MYHTPKWIKLAVVLSAGLRILVRPRQRLVLAACIGAYGDGVLFTGFLRELSRRCPAHRVRVVCSSRVFTVLQRELTGLEFVCVETRQRGGGIRGRLARVWQGVRIFMYRYEKAVNLSLRASGLSHEIVRATHAPVKAWFADGRACDEGEEVRDEDSIYTDLVASGGAPHVLDKMAALLSMLLNDGGSVVRSMVAPSFHLTEAERQFAAVTLGSRDREMRPVIAVCHGANFRRKDWGADNYARLLEAVGADMPISCVLLGGPEDCDKAELIINQLKHTAVNVLDLTGKTTVGESVALIADADLCIGNDTFGLHVTQAIGTPSLVLMWGGDLGPWDPWGDAQRHRMLTQPCEYNNCGARCKFEEWKCVKDISVDAAVKEVADMLQTVCVTHRSKA